MIRKKSTKQTYNNIVFSLKLPLIDAVSGFPPARYGIFLHNINKINLLINKIKIKLLTKLIKFINI